MRSEAYSIGVLTNDNLIRRQGAPVALTGATNTLTAAGILAGLVTINGANAGSVATTLGTGTLLDAALTAAFGPGTVAPGYSIDFSVLNISAVAAEDATIGTAGGWTLVGSMVVHANATLGEGGSAAGLFRARKTAANTFTLYRIG